MLYTFGTARLDVESRQLLCDGIERPLGSKAFNLLRLLLEFRPRVLTKVEIMDLVWPDAFVAEANVGILVADIRAAIGDGPGVAQLIKTHHGVGYSFCGSVMEQPRVDRVPIGGIQFLLTIGERRVVLTRGSLVVGRDMQCDVIVPDPSVSRRHAELRISAAAASIKDLDSKNGTKINDIVITTVTQLDDGARLTLGNAPATFHTLKSDTASTWTV